jgi:hypothetical protein
MGFSVIPGRLEEANPESRDSGFDAAHRPGMTVGRVAYARFLSRIKSAKRWNK